MNNFDLTKYLANNPLLKEGLSSKEQMVVDDILSVTEGPKDVYNKLVSYGKKGLISLAVLSSVLVGCAEQGDMESAEATIEYTINNDWAGSDREKVLLAILSYNDGNSTKEMVAASWAYNALKYNEELAWGKIHTNPHPDLQASYDEESQYIKDQIETFESDSGLTDKIVTNSLEDLKKLDKSDLLYKLVKR